MTLTLYDLRNVIIKLSTIENPYVDTEIILIAQLWAEILSFSCF